MARTRKKGNPIVSAVVFGIFGIVLLFLGIRTFIGLHGKLLNVTTCDESEVKPGVYVEGTLTYGYGAYIEKTTTYNHVVTKTDGYYYLVDICDKNEDGSKRDTSKWIGISISKSDDAKFDAISSADDAEPVYITQESSARTATRCRASLTTTSPSMSTHTHNIMDTLLQVRTMRPQRQKLFLTI